MHGRPMSGSASSACVRPRLTSTRRSSLVPAGGDRAGGHAQARLRHRHPEQLAVLGAGDRLVVGADQLHPAALQRAVVVQRLGEVQRGLPAERRQQRVGALALDHLRRRPRQQRLDIRGVRQLRVGHDRRRVGVHQHDLVPLLAQHLARLHAGVVELRGLPDHDRARAQDQNAVDVIPPGHQRIPSVPHREIATSAPGSAHAVVVTYRGGTPDATHPRPPLWGSP